MTTHERLRQALDYDPGTGQFTWRERRPGKVAGCRRNDGRVVIRLDGTLYLASRLAWFWLNGAWPVGDTEHCDLDRSNDRPSNLREATRSQNMANTAAHVDNQCGVKGVQRAKKRWRARICVNGQHRELGSFPTINEASAAYAKAAQ